MKVNIKNTSREYQGFFTLEKAKLQFEKFDGSMSDEVARENVYRGDSVAALIYDDSAKLVLFVEQFRYPVYTVLPEKAWLLEVVAGSRKRDEEPKDCLLRELKEEVHLQVSATELEDIGTFFVSPGGTSERIYLYALNTNLADFEKKHGGLVSEQEDIRIRMFTFQQIFNLLESNKLLDAKSIIGVQWLRTRLSRTS